MELSSLRSLTTLTPKGGVGLTIGGDQEVAFDNLTVGAITPLD